MDKITGTLEGLVSGAPAILAVLPLLALGVLLAYLAGCRDRMLLLAAAVPVTMGVASLVAQGFHYLGVGASLPLVTVGSVALTAALAAARWLLARHSAEMSSMRLTAESHLAPWWGAGIGALIGLAAWLPGFSDVRLPPQANDDIFHGYLIARLDSASDIAASTMAPVFVGTAEPVSYYPYGMHLVMAMDRTLTGAGVPLVMNGTWVLVVGLLLAVAAAALTRELFPSLPWAAFWAGLTAPFLSSFFLLNGVMSYAMTLAMGLVLAALVARRISRPTDVSGATIVFVAVGLFVGHPAVAVTAALIAGLVALEALALSHRANLRQGLIAVAVPGLAAAAVTVPWLRASPSSAAASSSNPVVDQPTALRMFLELGSPWAPAQTLLAILAAVGLLFCLVILRRGYAVVIAYMALGALYVGVLGGVSSITAWTGVWYGQWYRLMGAVQLLTPVLVGVALATLPVVLSRLSELRRLEFARRATPLLARGVVGVVVLALLFVGARYSFRGQSIVTTAWTPHSVTSADSKAFSEARSLNEGNDQVLGYWRDGSSWMYALDDVVPALPYDTSVSAEPWARTVVNDALTVRSDPEVCRQLLSRHVTLAAAKPVLNDGSPNSFFAQLDGNPDVFTPVVQNASISVYRIDNATLRTCADGPAP